MIRPPYRLVETPENVPETVTVASARVATDPIVRPPDYGF